MRVRTLALHGIDNPAGRWDTSLSARRTDHRFRCTDDARTTMRYR